LINHTKKSSLQSLQFSIDQSQKETKAVTTVEYNAEEPEKYFEKTFLVGYEKLTVSFDFPSLI